MRENTDPSVLDVLWRRVEVPALSKVARALGRIDDEVPLFRGWAIGLDSNVLLNMAKGRKATDVIDYLAELHEGPLILPAQVLQEFWNNRIYAVSGVADQIRYRFTELEKAVKEVDSAYRGFGEGLESLLEDFRESFGHVLEDRTSEEISSLLAMLSDKAITSECDRSMLGELANQRKRAKTPPGFKDEGDGDFLVWVDFLCGLADSRARDHAFTAAVLVTDDVKKDWSTKGTTNPILQAEVETLFGVPFFTVTLKKFLSLISHEMDSPSEEVAESPRATSMDDFSNVMATDAGDVPVGGGDGEVSSDP